MKIYVVYNGNYISFICDKRRATRGTRVPYRVVVRQTIREPEGGDLSATATGQYSVRVKSRLFDRPVGAAPTTSSFAT